MDFVARYKKRMEKHPDRIQEGVLKDATKISC